MKYDIKDGYVENFFVSNLNNGTIELIVNLCSKSYGFQLASSFCYYIFEDEEEDFKIFNLPQEITNMMNSDSFIHYEHRNKDQCTFLLVPARIYLEWGK